MDAADPVLITEFVDLPNIIPGPPDARMTASAGNDCISIDCKFCETIPRQTPSSSNTVPNNSHPSYFVTNPATS